MHRITARGVAVLNETAGLDEVAAALGKSPAWLMRHWLSFHRRTGFPRKIPAGWVWPRRAVELWLRSAGETPPLPSPANGNDPAGPDPVALAAASLMARYGATR
jgi:hypothetical protein